MIWPATYHGRLESWTDLRQRCLSLDQETALATIQNWWQRAPWRAYYLHWDDREHWPDPWQLLADNQYCDLARALGMLYTIKLLDRADCADAIMVAADQGNLVLVSGGKYIMNWKADEVVNMASDKIKIQRTLESRILDRLIG